MKLGLVLALLLSASRPALAQNVSSFGIGSTASCLGVPAPAQQAGLCQTTFAMGVGTPNPFSAANVDTAGTYNAGFMLYLYNWIGTTPTNTATFPGDGSVLLSGASCGDTFSACLATAGNIAGAPYFHGAAFGGAYYAEACLKYTPGPVTTGDPSWWSMSLEHLQSVATGLGQDLWTGQATGYSHFIEHDIEEAKCNSATAYNADPLDWYGPTPTSVAPSHNTGGCGRVPVGSSSFSSYQCYEELVVPATVSTKGFAIQYFNNQQLGLGEQWSQYVATSDTPPPTQSSPWLFGVGDAQHQVFKLGTGSSISMQVQSMHIYQANTSNNLTN